MAAKSRASSSKRVTVRAGEPTTRRHAPISSSGPGTVRVAALTDGTLQDLEGDQAISDLPKHLGDPATTVWVDLTDPSAEQVQAIGATLSLHPLIVEDVLEGNQRAKIETTDGVVHLVLFALTHGKRFVASEIDLVLGHSSLLTVHDGAWDPRAIHHFETGLAAILKRGPDHLLWAICDDVVDGYFPFADDLGEAIDAVQDRVIARATPEVLDDLFSLKRELIEVRRAAGPTREVFNQLTNRDLPLIDAEELVYFRDVYDHVIRLTDELDNYRELASSTLDVYLTQINNSLSVIMKRLTGVTVILAGIGAVAGIFGMSEAHTEGGSFWVVTAAILASAAIGAVILRRIDWI
jgi:magnesium transporter